jgi:hypothetical protein
MYKAAPPSQVAADTCRHIRDKVCAANMPFHMNACNEGLKPLSHYALGQFGGCLTTIREPDCQKAYQTCFHRVSSY